MNCVRVGIIGTGFTIGIAKAHVKGYSQVKDCKLTSLYDIVPGRAEQWREKNKLTDVACYDDFDAFIESVDAVSVCTPNNAHVEMMERCLKAGKHVITEKPVSSTLQEASKSLEFANKYPGLVSMVVFNYREIPGIAMIKDIIDSGKLGKIFLFRYILGGNRIGDAEKVHLEWRMQKELSGTGALADFTCHMLDLADYLTSKDMGKIKQVACFSDTFIKQRHEIGTGEMKDVTNDDASVIIARTEGGCLCSLTTCRLAVPSSTIEISAEGGTISHVIDEATMNVHFKPLNGSFSSKEETIPVEEKYNNDCRHTGVLNEFIQCILTGKKPVRSLEQGYYIQKILHALEQSSNTKQFVDVK